MSCLNKMLRINGLNMKVSTHFKDLVMIWMFGLMLKEKTQYGLAEISKFTFFINTVQFKFILQNLNLVQFKLSISSEDND